MEEGLIARGGVDFPHREESMKTTVILCVLLAGCGALTPHPDTGLHFTTEHGSARFGDAMEGARIHCSRLGMQAKHLGTDHGGVMMLSRFECVH